MTKQASGEWIRELNSTRELAPAAHPRLVARAKEVLGEPAFAWAVSLGHDMAAEIIHQVPEFAGADEDFETLRMGTEASALTAMLAVIGPDDEQVAVPEESLVGGRDFARRSIPLDRVLRGIRLGHSSLTAKLLNAVSEAVPVEDQPDELIRTSRRLFEFMDSFSTQMAAEYLTEHDRWVSSAAAERAEIVRNLLAGQAVPLEDAQKRLNYPLKTHHLALVVRQVGPGRSTGDLHRIAGGLLNGARPKGTLVVPHGANSVWVWAAWPAPLDSYPAIEVPEGIHVAAGRFGAGPAGFRRSHKEAEQTAQLVRSADGGGRQDPLTWYNDVELAVLLSGDLALARSFVARELGHLGVDTPHARELRETVAFYLSHDRSLAQASELLHVARNTVAYRVKKVESMLGHDLRTRRLELECALRLASSLGSQVLRRPTP